MVVRRILVTSGRQLNTQPRPQVPTKDAEACLRLPEKLLTTRSARPVPDRGSVNLDAFAVLRLMTSSNFGRFRAREDLVYIHGELPINLGDVRSIADKRPDFGNRPEYPA